MKHIRTTWKHIRRSPYQALAAIFVMMQTFFVVSLFAFLIFTSNKLINYFESLPQVNVFFNNTAKKQDIDSLISKLKATGKISKIHYVSKEEALKIYDQKFKDDPLLLEFVTADILPPSLEISATDINDLNSISSAIKSSPSVHEVIFPKDVVANLISWTTFLRHIGMALIVAFGLDAIFIMVIIIGIKISQRKEEMQVMRLLGATPWYVRMPFILEGMGYGIMGALIGWLVATGVLLYATPILSSYMQGIRSTILPIPPIYLLELLGIEALFGAILGMFSSFLAVLRQIK